MRKIPLSYYQQDNVVALAKNLLGKRICSLVDGNLTAGIISETEAYSVNDKACHAYQGKRTARTEVMFSTGGTAYVYLCYGIHHLFNIVANTQGIPEAVLVRAIEPLEGLPVMHERRNYRQTAKRLTSGPGNMSQALGITTALNGITLNGNLIWLEEHQQPDEQEIEARLRIGVNYAGADARLPWRFYLKQSPFISKL